MLRVPLPRQLHQEGQSHLAHHVALAGPGCFRGHHRRHRRRYLQQTRYLSAKPTGTSDATTKR